MFRNRFLNLLERKKFKLCNNYCKIIVKARGLNTKEPIPSKPVCQSITE